MTAIITCQKCQTKYQVSEQALGALGRKVRCTICKAIWFQLPPIDQDSSEISEHAPLKLDVPGLKISEELHSPHWFFKAMIIGAILILIYLGVTFKNDIIELLFQMLSLKPF